MSNASRPSPKSVSVKMECGCTHIITSRLEFKRRKLCRTHKLERLHVTADDVSLLPEDRPADKPPF